MSAAKCAIQQSLWPSWDAFWKNRSLQQPYPKLSVQQTCMDISNFIFMYGVMSEGDIVTADWPLGAPPNYSTSGAARNRQEQCMLCKRHGRWVWRGETRRFEPLKIAPMVCGEEREVSSHK